MKQLIRDLNLLLEETAAETAAKLNLTHAGFGNYKDEQGNVVAKSENGKLVKLGDNSKPNDSEDDADKDEKEIKNHESTKKISDKISKMIDSDEDLSKLDDKEILSLFSMISKKHSYLDRDSKAYDENQKDNDEFFKLVDKLEYPQHFAKNKEELKRLVQINKLKTKAFLNRDKDLKSVYEDFLKKIKEINGGKLSTMRNVDLKTGDVETRFNIPSKNGEKIPCEMTIKKDEDGTYKIDITRAVGKYNEENEFDVGIKQNKVMNFIEKYL